MTEPTTIVLYGATGDLSRRKLLPGLLHLHLAGLLGDARVVGTSVDELDREGFVELAEKAIREFSRREVSAPDWAPFS
jgi:glucose-6-phosphate 1-dehydrogenase